MIIDTKFSGQIEIKDEDVIYFEDGLLGFEDVKKYVLTGIEGNEFFKCLQSIEREEVAFIIINPWDVFKDYEIDIDDKEFETLGSVDIEDYVLYTLVTINQNKITTNLLGPVIINAINRKGKQTVLLKSDYTTRHDILQIMRKE